MSFQGVDNFKQGIAKEFTLDGPTIIDGVDGQLYIRPESRPGVAWLSIYTSGSDGLPGSPVYTCETEVIQPTPVSEFSNDNRQFGHNVYGCDNLNWLMPAERYWFVLEPADVDSEFATPIGITATTGDVAAWQFRDLRLEDGMILPYTWGEGIATVPMMRMSGHAVPEPASATLLALASLSFLSLCRRTSLRT